MIWGKGVVAGSDLPALSWISRWCRKTERLNSKSKRKATCNEEGQWLGRSRRAVEHSPDHIPLMWLLGGDAEARPFCLLILSLVQLEGSQ